jgi:ABC-type transport system substrate-binding protein
MAPDLQGLLVNMRDPVLGGLQPERVALRRAVNLAHLVGQDIERSYSGRAMVAQTFIPPLTSSFDANLRTEAGEHEQVKAKALLDMFGYLDRNKDGWRENPDGSPLVLRLTTQSDQTSRSRDDQLAVSLAKVGLRLELVVGEWSENIKAVYAGNFQLWRQGYAASSPDSLNVLSVLYGRGESNVSGFKLPEFDALYDRAADLDDGPERNRLIRRAALYAVAYAPFLAGIHRERLDLHHPWVIGYRRPVFAMDWWQYVDIRR